MTLEDLKVESASVNVSNSNEAEAKYRISANFNTRNNVLTSAEGGNVTNAETGERLAYFNVRYDSEKSMSVTYYGSIHDDVTAQTEINQLISDFMSLAESKAKSETND